ncbi:unnamed protein product [Protopolystoma xenopodis]|uniref:Uncharacterized protein n=1 Tax=Protopolystoma xenopodis TaxID=117903 RepID=A0A3S5AG45_9PLAT|nr:unnamed protein product [Protopolystoma xenopodis]
MAELTDDADYDAGETFENVPSALSDAGNQDNYYGRRLRTRCGTRGNVSEWLMCQAPILHCPGSTPAGGVGKTDARWRMQSTLDENNFGESKAM